VQLRNIKKRSVRYSWKYTVTSHPKLQSHWPVKLSLLVHDSTEETPWIDLALICTPVKARSSKPMKY